MLFLEAFWYSLPSPCYFAINIEGLIIKPKGRLGGTFEQGFFALFEVGYPFSVDCVLHYDLCLQPVQQIQGHVIQHLSEEISTFSAGWGEIDFDDPGFQLVVQNQVETVDFEGVGALLETVLNAFEGAVDLVSDLRVHVLLPCEI